MSEQHAKEQQEATFRSLTEMVQLARKHLERGDWDYLVGAADTQALWRRDRAGVESCVF